MYAYQTSRLSVYGTEIYMYVCMHVSTYTHLMIYTYVYNYLFSDQVLDCKALFNTQKIGFYV